VLFLARSSAGTQKAARDGFPTSRADISSPSRVAPPRDTTLRQPVVWLFTLGTCFNERVTGGLGVLLIGYGQAGRFFHRPLIGAAAGLDIRGVVTGSPERRAQVLKDLPGVRIHHTAEDAWLHLEDIDVVVIASANRTHVPLALKAAQHGLHMVIDKPMAASAKMAEIVFEAAAAAGVQIHPFQNRRWDSDFLTLCLIADQGILGSLHRLESRFERLRTVPTGNWRESGDPKDLGGVHLDYGAHLVDQAIALMGPVTRVTAHIRSLRDPLGANDDVEMILSHRDSSISLLIASQASAFGVPRFLLTGTTGGVRVDEPDTQQAALKKGIIPSDPNYGVEAVGVTAHLRIREASGEIVDSRVQPSAGNWNIFYPRVHASIARGQAAPVLCSDVLANLRVLDAARRSAETGEVVRLNPPAAHESTRSNDPLLHAS
jgi:scyllo-inositol 2-dehydrogenase (NADP+)